MEKEVKKILDSHIIIPLRYSKWITKLVPVRKKNGEIRLYVDFRNLNMYSRKDNYPLPKMEHIFQRVTCSTKISMIDGFSGYIQIIFFFTRHGEDRIYHSLGYIHVCQDALRYHECRGNLSTDNGYFFYQRK
jgi:hypothetical protein